MTMKRRIGILTSGGDCPGLNACIRGVARASYSMFDTEIVGIQDGYAGWPKAWAAFRMAKEVWAEDDAADAKAEHQNEMVFPIGAPNDAFAPLDENALRVAIDATGYTAGEIHAAPYEKKGLFSFLKK